jgi:hypothetical protein
MAAQRSPSPHAPRNLLVKDEQKIREHKNAVLINIDVVKLSEELNVYEDIKKQKQIKDELK